MNTSELIAELRSVRVTDHTTSEQIRMAADRIEFLQSFAKAMMGDWPDVGGLDQRCASWLSWPPG